MLGLLPKVLDVALRLRLQSLSLLLCVGAQTRGLLLGLLTDPLRVAFSVGAEPLCLLLCLLA